MPTTPVARGRGRRRTAALIISIASVAAACATSLEDIDFTPPEAVRAEAPTTPRADAAEGGPSTPTGGDGGTDTGDGGTVDGGGVDGGGVDGGEAAPSAGGDGIGAFTGLPVAEGADADAPALAVRIDNSVEALPQRGLREADVVVENLIESGITRLLAVFHSEVPITVGPVRSARSTDIELLANFSDPGFVYWSSNVGVAQEIGTAVEAGLFTDLGIGAVPLAYYREDLPGRPLEQTGYVRLPEVAAARTDGAAPFPLFTYGDVATDAAPAAGVLLDWPAGQRASFVWNEPTGTWLRSQWDGVHVDETGTVIEAANVIVMVTPYGVSTADPRSPQAVTVGAGRALVLRDGVVIEGTWERRDVVSNLRLLDAEGVPVTLRPGPTWIALAPPDVASLLTPEEASTLLAEAAPRVDAG